MKKKKASKKVKPIVKLTMNLIVLDEREGLAWMMGRMAKRKRRAA